MLPVLYDTGKLLPQNILHLRQILADEYQMPWYQSLSTKKAMINYFALGLLFSFIYYTRSPLSTTSYLSLLAMAFILAMVQLVPLPLQSCALLCPLLGFLMIY